MKVLIYGELEIIIKIEQMLSGVKSIREIFKPLEFEGFKKETSDITKILPSNNIGFNYETY